MTESLPSAISIDIMLPRLLTRHPRVRPVLDRYGLSGCGGETGPEESLRFFARTHGVDEQHLLKQVQEAASAPAAAATPDAIASSTLSDTIYRRFFLGGIAVILTAGATWGATLLWQIGFRGKFTGVSIHTVNAHGHAQIYGWVGLFMMGFAYQAFPRMWHTRLVAPRLAVAAFALMTTGIAIRSLFMPFAGDLFAIRASLIGGAMELAACCTFVAQMLVSFSRRDRDVRMEPYIGFVVAALFWLIAMATADLWYTYATMAAPDRDHLLWLVATYQAPLRDLQIHGLALSMILGVSLRMLPALFDVPKISDRRAWIALALLTLSVVGETAIFIAYRWTGNHVLAAFLMIPWLMMTVAIAMVALPWKLWRPMPVADRSGKFVRIAYTWLAISMVMLLLLPVYMRVSGIPFSHAYYGSIRHAITVGFISMMILGFAAKVTATLNGHDSRNLSPMWGPFVLVNVGCLLRVSFQTLTDWSPSFFPLVGISGTLEVIGLAWWSAHLIRVMRTAPRAITAPPDSHEPLVITPDTYIEQLITRYPQTLAVFTKYGFALLANPIARRTMARGVTVAQAARLRDVCADELLVELRLATGQVPTEGGRACDGCDHD